MNIVLTGAAGNITKPLAEKILAQGHVVTVIGRNAENLQPLVDKGAVAAPGSIEDQAFLTEAFRGADAVYTMIPVPYHASDWVAYGQTIGANYVSAIRGNGVKKVVNLSTYGAHRLEGIGPVHSIAQVEKALDAGCRSAQKRAPFREFGATANCPGIRPGIGRRFWIRLRATPIGLMIRF